MRRCTKPATESFTMLHAPEEVVRERETFASEERSDLVLSKKNREQLI